jgi:DNA-binding LacI/PurR family transcriptional regulator
MPIPKTTIRDIAHKANVTITTVSLAFQPGSRISDRMRKKIFTIARELNYVPNLAARQLRQGKSRVKNLGMLVNDIRNPFNAMMFHAAQRVAARRGYEIIIADSQWSPEKELAHIKSLTEFRVDGLLVSFCEKALENLDWLNRFSGPFLLLDGFPASYTGPYVANNISQATEISIHHLIDVGCRHLVFASAETDMDGVSAIIAMRQQFKKVLLQENFPFDDRQMIPVGLTIEKGEQAFEAILKNNPKVDGIFCANSLPALGVMSAAKQRGIRVGKDLAVMGIDDLDICRLPFVSLTTIRFSYDEMAQVATNILIDSIEEKKMPDAKIMLKPELVIRESTNRGGFI